MTADLQPLQRGIVNTVRQVADVANARVEPFEERLAMKADALTRGAYYAATADLLQTALHRAIDAAYEAVDGVLVGCEPSGRCNAPLPWSTRSHGLYALRRSQSDVLRLVVTSWQSEHAAGRYDHAPVFVFDGDAGKWYVNLAAYPNATAAHRAIGKWLSPSYVRRVELQLRKTTKQTSTNAAPTQQRSRTGTASKP